MQKLELDQWERLGKPLVVRFFPSEIRRIQELIQKKAEEEDCDAKYNNVSQFVRVAIQRTLREEECAVGRRL